MPGKVLHAPLTHAAIQSLPPAQRALWDDVREPLLEEYCMFPDNWYGQPEKIGPYLCFTDGVPFHYPPNELVVYNHWEVVPGKDGSPATLKSTGLPENKHHRHCRKGFDFYLHSIPRALREGRMEDAARFAGAISHVLQDNTTPTHCLEGMDGSDVMLLDRYVAPPEDKPEWTPSRVFREIMQPLDWGPLPECGRPLGRSAKEAGFLFYTRFCRVVEENRLCVLPLLQAVYAGKESVWQELLRSILRRTVALNADFLATCHFLAESATRAQPSDEPVYLSDLRPARFSRFLSKPYMEAGILRDKAFTPDKRFAPLELELEKGQVETFERGLGMGAHAEFFFEHELPSETYTHLEGAIGLHARFGGEGKVAVQWELDDRILWQDRFDNTHPAARFQIPVKSGGVLRLRGFSESGRALDPANHVVLGNPVLET